MTTKQQKRFFFPLWNQTCRALGWKMEDGRLVLPDGRRNEHQKKVIAEASALAAKEHRAPVLNDLRHGCYIVALGHDVKTLKMSNQQVDKVTSLFKLLVNDTDIAADMKLANPDIGERERLVRKINALKIPDAMIDAVCKKSFAPVYTAPFYEDLPILRLRSLTGILVEIKERKSEVRSQNLETPELLAVGAAPEYPR